MMCFSSCIGYPHSHELAPSVGYSLSTDGAAVPAWFCRQNLKTRSISENLVSLIKMSALAVNTDFYLRYYVGHKGKFGHEFLEFEFRPDGKFFVFKLA